jgi:hypothetical protein
MIKNRLVGEIKLDLLVITPTRGKEGRKEGK